MQHLGLPVALYTDRHGVFRHTPGSGLPGMPTQFSRAMDELGIQMVFALSPQAKGRVERTAGTFQDRLVTELRLAGASDHRGGQRRAGGLPATLQHSLRSPWRNTLRLPTGPLDPDACLDTVLCFKHRRVARDNTVKYRWRTLQLLPGHGTPQLRRGGGRSLGRTGRSAGCAAPGSDHPQPGGAAPPWHTQKLQRLLRHTGRSLRLASTVWAGAGRLSWRHSGAPTDTDRQRPCRQFGKAAASPSSKPTPFRRRGGTLFRKAKRRGLSLRAIARELAIHGTRRRSTWKLRARREAPSGADRTPSVIMASSSSDIFAGRLAGHFR